MPAAASIPASKPSVAKPVSGSAQVALTRQDLAEPPHGGPDRLYRPGPARCTGCNFCRDVCEYDAIHLAAWSRPTQDTLYLRAKLCSACGTRFHYPAAQLHPPKQ